MIFWCAPMTIHERFTPLELQSPVSIRIQFVDGVETRVDVTLVEVLQATFTPVLPSELNPRDQRELAKARFLRDPEVFVTWSDGKKFTGAEIANEIDKPESDCGVVATRYAVLQATSLLKRARSQPAINDLVPRTIDALRRARVSRRDDLKVAPPPEILMLAPLEPDAEVVAGVHLRLLRTDGRFPSKPKLHYIMFEEATQGNLISRLSSHQLDGVRLIVGASHGTRQRLQGFEGADLLSSIGSGTWGEVFKDRIIHLCACYTSVTLGRDLVDDTLGKAKAFFGYNFEILSTSRVQAEAAAFDHTISLSLLAGRTCQEALSDFGLEIDEFQKTNQSVTDKYTQEMISTLSLLSASAELIPNDRFGVDTRL